MAIVKSGVVPEGLGKGAKYRVLNDYYVNNTPERNEELRQESSQIAHNICVQYALKRQGGENQCRESQG